MYIEDSQLESGEKLRFRPVNLLKGEMDLNDLDGIYVQLLHNESDPNVQDYQSNSTYLLFLEKHRSVFYDHDIYVQITDLHLSSDDNEWGDYLNQVETVLAESKDPAPSSYAVEFAHSTDLKEILQVTDNIFIVKIDGILAESTINPTTVYNVSVKETIKNTPTNDGDILITIFNDTVEVGGEYLILLADATKTAPVYTLSSRNSVYNLEEAEKHPELRNLIKEANEY